MRLKRIVVFLVCTIVLISISGCGGKKLVANGPVEYETDAEGKIIADYSNAETFEAALNNGEDVTGKVVSFVARDIKPRSALGFNVWAGEHLNFVSNGDQGIKTGDTATAFVKSVETTLGGSWVIKYELLGVNGNPTDLQNNEAEYSEPIKEILYDGDEVVNDFIIVYNAISSSPIIDINMGNIRQKVYGHTYDRQIEILDGADDMLHVTLFADYDHPELWDLREAFHDVIISLDSSIVDDEVYAAFDSSVNAPRSDMSIGKVTYRIFPKSSINNGRIELEIPKE